MTTQDIIDPLAGAAAPLPAECCGRCRFLFSDPTNQNPSFCRRHPPTPFIVRVQWDEKQTAVLGQQMVTSFPSVHPFGWCGEFEVNPSKVNDA